ncbi:MAG: FG-GAP repeat protein [Candidatus Cloacimonetes bacterium]|nr:FG-GAP repeat protein [Candidatus Cloacimonadota bacterium]
MKFLISNFKYLILSLLIINSSLLITQNNLEQLAYLEGENEDDRFGKFITSLDFNGDGYDDLVVIARAWGQWRGKLYCYLGGEVFDTEPDFTISGNLDSYVKSQVTNLGDLNNDGYEDLGMERETADNFLIQILYGNTELDSIPDFELSVSKEDYAGVDIRALGDINNDGYDDTGIVKSRYYSIQENFPFEFYLCFGNQDDLTVEYFGEWGDGFGPSGFSGIGDVNNDGYDDFCIGYSYEIEEERRYTNTLYYGSETIEPEPDLILWDLENTNMTLGLPAGDLNADGYDDFAGHLTTTVDYNIRLWYGQEIVTQTPDLLLNYGYGGGGADYAFDFGDVNNDGYSDIAIGSPGAGLNGKAYLYLGGENPNNTYDYEFEEPPGVNHDYGTAVTVGRFDGDEYDDIAISGPMDGSGQNHGYIHIFAGNGELVDLVDAEDEEIPLVSNVVFNAYPNPFNPSITFSVKFTTEFTESTEIQIFNIKGQKIETLNIENLILNNEIEWKAEDHASGIYFCKLVNVETGSILSVKKVTLLK